jgi:hypothetical protein
MEQQYEIRQAKSKLIGTILRLLPEKIEEHKDSVVNNLVRNYRIKRNELIGLGTSVSDYDEKFMQMPWGKNGYSIPKLEDLN